MVHHGEYLRAITRDDLLIWHLEHDDSQAGLDPQERAMLDFARKLNDEPSKMDAEDIQQLRSVGFDDRGALDIVMVISVFSLLNRWADAVGVAPLEHLLRAKERGDRRAQEQLQGSLAAAGK